MAATRKKLGDLLVEAGAIDAMQLQAALGFQRQWGGKLGAVLVDRGFISEPKLVQTLAQQLGVAVVQISKLKTDARAMALVPPAVAATLRVFPLELKGPEKSETLVVAMSDPTDLTAVDQLQFRTRKRIQAVLAGDRDISTAIRRHYHNENVAPPEDLPAGQAATRKPTEPPAARGSASDKMPGLVDPGDRGVRGTTPSMPPVPASRVPLGTPPAMPVMSRPPPARGPTGTPVLVEPVAPGGLFGRRGAVESNQPSATAPYVARVPTSPPPSRAPAIDPFAELEPTIDVGAEVDEQSWIEPPAPTPPAAVARVVAPPGFAPAPARPAPAPAPVAAPDLADATDWASLDEKPEVTAEGPAAAAVSVPHGDLEWSAPADLDIGDAVENWDVSPPAPPPPAPASVQEQLAAIDVPEASGTDWFDSGRHDEAPEIAPEDNAWVESIAEGITTEPADAPTELEVAPIAPAAPPVEHESAADWAADAVETVAPIEEGPSDPLSWADVPTETEPAPHVENGALAAETPVATEAVEGAAVDWAAGDSAETPVVLDEPAAAAGESASEWSGVNTAPETVQTDEPPPEAPAPPPTEEAPVELAAEPEAVAETATPTLTPALSDESLTPEAVAPPIPPAGEVSFADDSAAAETPLELDSPAPVPEAAVAEPLLSETPVEAESAASWAGEPETAAEAPAAEPLASEPPEVAATTEESAASSWAAEPETLAETPAAETSAAEPQLVAVAEESAASSWAAEPEPALEPAATEPEKLQPPVEAGDPPASENVAVAGEPPATVDSSEAAAVLWAEEPAETAPVAAETAPPAAAETAASLTAAVDWADAEPAAPEPAPAVESGPKEVSESDLNAAVSWASGDDEKAPTVLPENALPVDGPAAAAPVKDGVESAAAEWAMSDGPSEAASPAVEAVAPAPAAVQEPPPAAPDPAAVKRGWDAIGIAQPTQQDAVDVVGSLIDLLVSKGSLKSEDLAAAVKALKLTQSEKSGRE